MPPEAAIASSSHPPRRREEPDKTKSPVADGVERYFDSKSPIRQTLPRL
jgi:hypothetical protein